MGLHLMETEAGKIRQGQDSALARFTFLLLPHPPFAPPRLLLCSLPALQSGLWGQAFLRGKTPPLTHLPFQLSFSVSFPRAPPRDCGSVPGSLPTEGAATLHQPEGCLCHQPHNPTSHFPGPKTGQGLFPSESTKCKDCHSRQITMGTDPSISTPWWHIFLIHASLPYQPSI